MIVKTVFNLPLQPVSSLGGQLRLLCDKANFLQRLHYLFNGKMLVVVEFNKKYEKDTSDKR